MADRGDSWYSGWHWWWDPKRPVTQTCPLIISIPLDVRALIWSHLNAGDHKSLRQVCKLFEFDVNQVVGVDAVLYGNKISTPSGEPSSILSEAIAARSLLFGDAEAKQVQENANWIQNVLTRSLNIRRFSGVKFDTSALVKKPMLLRSLTIEFDQRQQQKSLQQIKEVLQQYNHLTRLGLSFSTEDFEAKDYQSYNNVVVGITEHLFNSLEFKPSLSELSLAISYSNVKVTPPTSTAIDHFDQMINRVIGTVPEVPAVLDAWLQDPTKLTKIAIEMPSLSINHLRRWKKFIDGQDRLTHLKINFGHVHWNFFSSVLQRCAGSLEAIDLVLINYYSENVIPEVNTDPVPEDQWFNWNMIAQSTNKLKSIRICTQHSDMKLLWQYVTDTIKFDRLTFLKNLNELKLLGVYLTQADLEIVFNGGVLSLRNVELTSWTKVSEAFVPPAENVTITSWTQLVDFSGRNQHLCNLLTQVLPFSRLSSIKLIDISVYLCDEELRQSILEQPAESRYTVTWPVEQAPFSINRHLERPLTIKQN